jgi:hypothetical protein
MTKYISKPRLVSAVEIVSVSPLLGRNGSTVMSPDQGLLLTLSDHLTFRWIAADKDGGVPEVGAWFVRDSELGTSYIVSAAKFSELFEAV